MHGLKDSIIGMTALIRLKSVLEENQAEKQGEFDTQSSQRNRERRKVDNKTKR